MVYGKITKIHFYPPFGDTDWLAGKIFESDMICRRSRLSVMKASFIGAAEWCSYYERQVLAVLSVLWVMLVLWVGWFGWCFLVLFSNWLVSQMYIEEHKAVQRIEASTEPSFIHS